MRSHRPNILAPAALILVAALAACSSMPQRLARQAQPTQPPAQLDLELVDRLGQDWSINYVQVYLDGWLIWQGAPQSGSRSLGSAGGNRTRAAKFLGINRATLHRKIRKYGLQ